MLSGRRAWASPTSTMLLPLPKYSSSCGEKARGGGQADTPLETWFQGCLGTSFLSLTESPAEREVVLEAGGGTQCSQQAGENKDGTGDWRWQQEQEG